MNRTNYAKRAAKRFLFGTRCRTPVEAVERGERTLSEWAQVLAEERERAEAIVRFRKQKRGINARETRYTY